MVGKIFELGVNVAGIKMIKGGGKVTALGDRKGKGIIGVGRARLYIRSLHLEKSKPSQEG